MIQNRVDIGPEAPAVRHWHPGEEVIYVLEGSLEYRIDGEGGNAAELTTYFVEKGQAVPRGGRLS